VYFKQMQVHPSLFPRNTIDLQNKKVLIQPEHVDSTKGKSVIIVEERPKSLDGKTWLREVMLEKVSGGGKETLKITVKSL
jgi:hypothetical protein